MFVVRYTWLRRYWGSIHHQFIGDDGVLSPAFGVVVDGVGDDDLGTRLLGGESIDVGALVG